jgi:uncharacterized LabA/DUF88 family protein
MVFSGILLNEYSPRIVLLVDHQQIKRSGLISSDRDFIPAINLLSIKGYKVNNAHFPPKGSDLSRACWGEIDLLSLLPKIKRESLETSI